MRKIIFILLSFVSLLVFSENEKCSKIYNEGVDLYKKGKYIEAQLKFIYVVKECGNYAGVYNLLQTCNEKILLEYSEQNKQISFLRQQQKQLELEKEKLDAKSKDLAEAIGKIRKLEKINLLRMDSIKELKSCNLEWRNSLVEINTRLDSITIILDSINENINVVRKNQDKNYKKN